MISHELHLIFRDSFNRCSMYHRPESNTQLVITAPGHLEHLLDSRDLLEEGVRQGRALEGVL